MAASHGKDQNRLPLLCMHCPKIVDKLTQHLQDKHKFSKEEARQQRQAAYEALIKSIREHTIIHEDEIIDLSSASTSAVDVKVIKGILHHYGHIIVENQKKCTRKQTNTKKKQKEKEDTRHEDLFTNFPCTAHERPPSRGQMSKKYGKKSLAVLGSRWRYKQMQIRAGMVNDAFTRKCPNEKQIKNYFSSMSWKLNKKQMTMAQKSLKDKWDGEALSKNNRRKPVDDRQLRQKIEEQSWEGLTVIDNLEGRGKGVFTSKSFNKGDVLCDYQGVMNTNLTLMEAEKYINDNKSSIYIMQVKHDSRYTVVDATEDDGKIGRLINHSKLHANVRPEKRMLLGKLHIIITAKCDVEAGREVLYDYKDPNSTLPECVPGCFLCLREGRFITDQVDDVESSEEDNSHIQI